MKPIHIIKSFSLLTLIDLYFKISRDSRKRYAFFSSYYNFNEKDGMERLLNTLVSSLTSGSSDSISLIPAYNPCTYNMHLYGAHNLEHVLCFKFQVFDIAKVVYITFCGIFTFSSGVVSVVKYLILV